MSKTNAVVSLAVAGFTISWASILIIWSGMNPIAVSFWRTALASLALTPLMIKDLRGQGLNIPLKLLALGGLALAIHFMTWITSLYYTTVAMSVTIVSTYSVFTIPITLAIGRRVSGLTVIGASLALIGVAVMMYSSYGLNTGNLLGDALALAGSASGAFYFIIGELSRVKAPTSVYSTLVYALAALFTAPVALIMGINLTPPSVKSLVMIALIVAGPMLMGHTLLNYSLKYLPATVVSTVTLIEPAGSTILAYMLLHQPVNLIEAASMVVTLIGVYLSIRGGLMP
ncbi:DMT family transporter [Caldivirga sp. UBA161]|uniref:DMT family transporter n=1 Tax=Caldivirga sp. UBA161 TaxID=1915569 RepID=UPI0025BF7C7B|nr:DMT family transporter [Caldivirga sp. UBA161]